MFIFSKSAKTKKKQRKKVKLLLEITDNRETNQDQTI